MNNSVSTMSGKVKIKVVLLGNQSVGKSSIIEKYVKDVFDETNNPTVGIDFLVKNVTHKAKSYRLQLWDTAGQERFRSLIPNYLKDAKCSIIVVDVTSKSSLNSVEEWLTLYNDNKTVEGYSFLIGNKIDLEYRQISQQEAQEKAKQLGIPYFEVSAKTGENIEQFFNKIIDVTQDQSLSAANFALDARKPQNGNTVNNPIQQQNEEQGQTKTKAVEKKSEGTGNIVLKNEKKEKDEKGKKKNDSCC